MNTSGITTDRASRLKDLWKEIKQSHGPCRALDGKVFQEFDPRGSDPAWNGWIEEQIADHDDRPIFPRFTGSVDAALGTFSDPNLSSVLHQVARDIDRPDLSQGADIVAQVAKALLLKNIEATLLEIQLYGDEGRSG